MRSILSLLTVAAATLAVTATADAAPRVAVSVTIRNGLATTWPVGTLTAKLPRGTHVGRVTGGSAKLRHGRITVKPRGARKLAAGAKRRLTITLRGKPPRSWSYAAQPCTTSHAHRVVTCVVRPGKASGGTGQSVPAPGTAPGAAVTPPYAFAPYADMAGWPPPDLDAIRAGSGAAHISLGFVTQSAAGGCTPTWGGYAAYPATGAGAYRRAQVQAFRSSGGDVVVSFGGAAGVELAQACDSAAALAAAYQAVLDAYGATHADFDIEGATLSDTPGNARRAQAIAALQAARPALAVSFTLPTTPDGLSADGVAAVAGAVAAGVRLSLVNVMTMDYNVPGAAGHMGEYAIRAGTALHAQLTAISPSLSAWAMIGVTPMIGINDASDEIFTLQDAAAVEAWAATTHIGMLGMWSLARDAECPAPTTTTQPACSGVAQSPWAFAKALGAFTG